MARVAGDTVLGGRYRVIERIGAGGMATVYLAEDERLGRRVAVKRLHSDSDQDSASRFEREAKLLASLNHPNLVSVYDAHVDEDELLIAMEHVPGETLRAALDRGPLDPGRALAVVRGVAAALDHAHAQAIVHRDVKPANVLLGEDGTVKLADLGVASAAERTQITLTGTALGTPAYMAPEQLEGGRVGPAADVYALGALAYEALTGRRARPGRTPMEIAHRAATEPPPDLRDARPDAPPAAATVLREAMDRDPSVRPRTAGELGARLAGAFEGEVDGEGTRAPGAAATPSEPTLSTHALPAPGGSRSPMSASRASWVRWLPAALALALVATMIAILAGGDDPPSDRAAPGDDATQEPRQEEDAAPPEDSGSEDQADGGDVARGRELNDQGFALLNEGRYDEAVDVLRRAVDAFPDGTSEVHYAYALFNLGKALRLAGRPEEAIPILERRLQIPNQTEVVQAELDAARADLEGGEEDRGRGNGRGPKRDRDVDE